MTSNGRRRPPRPRIKLITPAPSEGEAAAIAAAIELFIADTTPERPTGPGAQSPWQRAAIHEGVGARRALGFPWGEPPGWAS